MPRRRRPHRRHRPVLRPRHPATLPRGRRRVLAPPRSPPVRPVRPPLRRDRAGQAPRVQRRHPDQPGGELDRAVVLAARRLPRRRPVELHPRAAGRPLGVASPARGSGALRVDERRPDRRGGDDHRLPAGDRRAGRARHGPDRDGGHRLGSARPPVRRPGRAGHPVDLQALPLGVDRQRAVRAPRHRPAALDDLDRAAVEDAAVEQGAARDPLGAVPRPPQPAPRLPRRAPGARIDHRVRAQAAARPRGRLDPRPRARGGAGDLGRLRRRGLRLPAVPAPARLRRMAARARRLGGARRIRRARHPRDLRADHRRHLFFRSPGFTAESDGSP